MKVRAQYRIGFAQQMGFSVIIKYANTTTSHEEKFILSQSISPRVLGYEG